MARLRQDKLRELVRDYFHAQLAEYIEWINNRGMSSMAIEDARSEMLDHQDHLESQRLSTMYLPIDRFKRTAGLTDEDWMDSLPNALTELSKGRRDMLEVILETIERQDRNHFSVQPAAPSAIPLPTSALLGVAVEDYLAETTRELPHKTASRINTGLPARVSACATDGEPVLSGDEAIST